MCEPFMVERTGLSVREHQERTVTNFLEIRALAPELPVIPVLQGWLLADYLVCVDMYFRAGVDLSAEPLVGLGSVCRRQSTEEIAAIVTRLHQVGLRLHGFGVKSEGLRRYGQHLASADSMAWSLGGRYVRGCRHRVSGHVPVSEANCLSFAREWRGAVVGHIRTASPGRERGRVGAQRRSRAESGSRASSLAPHHVVGDIHQAIHTN